MKRDTLGGRIHFIGIELRMSLPEARRLLVSALLAALLPLGLSGCSQEPVPFTGTWRGANVDLSDATLVLTQIGDSLSGTLLVTFAQNGQQASTSVASWYLDGDSVRVAGLLNPSTGYNTLGFGGRRMGSDLQGNVLLLPATTLETAVTLRLQ